MGSDVGFSDYPAAWTLMTLGELLDLDGGSVQTGPFGSQLHAADYVSEGIPSVMPKNISIEGINESDIARITEEDALRLSKYLMAEGDIVYSRRGDVEKCALVKEHESGWLCGTGCLRVRLNKNSRITPNYLHAYLSSPEIREWISRNAIGATMPNLNTSILRDIPVLVPEERDIKFTSNIWNDLNSKIQLNRETNKTLEAMAQALFKSWFVDFDPVIDNALAAGNKIPEPFQARAAARKTALAGLPKAQRALFPSEFEETEALGWVPKGWGIGLTSDIATTNEISWTKKNAPLDVNYVDLANAKNGRIQETTNYSYDEAPSRAKRCLSIGDTIIGLVRPGNRSFAYISVSGLTGSTGFAVMRPKNINLQAYLYFHLTRDDVIDEFARLADGAAYPAIRPEVVSNLECMMPSAELLHEFQQVAGNLLEKIGFNVEDIKVLESLRDTLLPKLISGELRLPDADQQAEQQLNQQLEQQAKASD